MAGTSAETAASLERLKSMIGVIEQFPTEGTLAYRQDAATGERTAVGFVIPEDLEDPLSPYVLVFPETGQAYALWPSEDEREDESEPMLDGDLFRQLVEPEMVNLVAIAAANEDPAVTQGHILDLLLPHAKMSITNRGETVDIGEISDTMLHVEEAFNTLEQRVTFIVEQRERQEQLARQHEIEAQQRQQDEERLIAQIEQERREAMQNSVVDLGTLASGVLRAAGVRRDDESASPTAPPYFVTGDEPLGDW